MTTKTRILPFKPISASFIEKVGLGIQLSKELLKKHQNEPYMTHNEYREALFRTYVMLHHAIPCENAYLELAYKLINEDIEKAA
jgi:hypothetical protein